MTRGSLTSQGGPSEWRRRYHNPGTRAPGRHDGRRESPRPATPASLRGPMFRGRRHHPSAGRQCQGGERHPRSDGPTAPSRTGERLASASVWRCRSPPRGEELVLRLQTPQVGRAADRRGATSSLISTSIPTPSAPKLSPIETLFNTFLSTRSNPYVVQWGNQNSPPPEQGRRRSVKSDPDIFWS